MLRRLAEFKIALICCCFLALVACSKKNQPNLEGDNAGSAVPGSEKDFAINVGDRVYFIVDTSTLTPEAQETLRRQAAWLRQYTNDNVPVEGHSDERGTREYNISLSARRATSTREFLIAQGVQGNRISSIDYGYDRPVAFRAAATYYSLHL